MRLFGRSRPAVIGRLPRRSIGAALDDGAVDRRSCPRRRAAPSSETGGRACRERRPGWRRGPAVAWPESWRPSAERALAALRLVHEGDAAGWTARVARSSCRAVSPTPQPQLVEELAALSSLRSMGAHPPRERDLSGHPGAWLDHHGRVSEHRRSPARGPPRPSATGSRNCASCSEIRSTIRGRASSWASPCGPGARTRGLGASPRTCPDAARTGSCDTRSPAAMPLVR